MDSKGQQNKILEKIYRGVDIDKYTNILDIYYDIDYKTFRNTIIYSILKEYLVFWDSFYNQGMPEVSADLIKERKQLLFLSTPVLFKAIVNNNRARFNDSKLKQLLDQVEKEKGLKAESSWGVMIAKEEASKIVYLIDYVDPKIYVLSILKRKKSKILNPPYNEEMFLNRNKVNIDIEREYYPLYIDSDLNSIANSPEYFRDINYILITNRYSKAILSHDSCLELLKEIETDIHKEKEADYLLEGF